MTIWDVILSLQGVGTPVYWLRRMGEEQKEFTLVIRGGGANGEDVSYENLHYSVLRAQVGSWEDMLGAGVDPVISIERGSLKFVFLLVLSVYESLVADICALSKGETQLNLPSRRKWYNRMVRDTKDKGWSFSLFGGDRELMALSAAASTVRRSSVLPRLTTIVQGKIMQVGGKTPGIRVETGKGTIVVWMSEEEIRKENLVYQERNIEVSYRYDPETGEESNFQFIRFIDTPEYDRDSMLALIAQETEAWRDVDNVTEWVETQRGKESLKGQLSQI